MKYITGSIGKFVVTGLLFFMISVQSFSQDKNKREFYQVTVYHYTTSEQEQIIDQYLEKAWLPALHRMRISDIGVFAPVTNDTATDKRIYVVVPLQSLDALTKIPATLAKDKNYQAEASAYLDASYDKAPYQRMESILLQAFTKAPKMQRPALKGSMDQRIFELRSYESATEKIFANKVKMFNEGNEISIFRRLHFNAIFYGEVMAGGRMPNLMYMTSFENMDDRNAHWKSFSADAEWKTVSSLPEYQHNVSHIDIILMHPKPYSDY
jgi:hypothetical protein